MSGMWDHEEAGAFVETLFAKHHGEIYAYLLRMLREPELAADLTQDAFIKAYKNYETLEKPENARAWLYQIAHRVALDEIRRRKIIRFFPWTGESRGSAPSAEHLVMDAHLSGDMQRALARIPERQRAALLLAELHDLTGVELAAALGVSHVAARALLTRARESLRQALAAERAAEAEAEAERDCRAPRGASTDEPHRRVVAAGAGRTLRPRTSARGARRRAARRAARDRRTPHGSTSTSRAAIRAARSPPPTKRTGSRSAVCATSSLSRRATCGRAPPPPSNANRRRSRQRPTRRIGRSRRSGPALGVLSGIAVIAVVIGASVLSGRLRSPGPPTALDPQRQRRRGRRRARATPGPTPDGGRCRFGRLGRDIGRRRAGLQRRAGRRGLSGRAPARLRPDRRPPSRHVDLTIRPKSISQSPVRNQAVVVGTDASGSDSVLVIVAADRRSRPRRRAPTPTPGADTEPTPTADAERRHRSDRAPSAAASTEPSSGASEPPASATPEPTAAPTATPEPTRATPTMTPGPTLVGEPGHRVGGQGRRPVRRVLAGRRRGSRSPRARPTARPARTSTSGGSATSSPGRSPTTTPASSHRGPATGSSAAGRGTRPAGRHHGESFFIDPAQRRRDGASTARVWRPDRRPGASAGR